MIIKVIPAIDYSVRRLCPKPYYNHPRGCPNFGRKKGCPPGAPLFDQVYDISQPVYAIINEFDIGSHIERMREKHPEWSEHQLKCVLYWQGGARKQLKGRCIEFLRSHPGYQIEMCPEAMGVNITETLRSVGIELEWPPVHIARQVALAGIRKKRKFFLNNSCI